MKVYSINYLYNRQTVLVKDNTGTRNINFNGRRDTTDTLYMPKWLSVICEKIREFNPFIKAKTYNEPAIHEQAPYGSISKATRRVYEEQTNDKDSFLGGPCIIKPKVFPLDKTKEPIYRLYPDGFKYFSLNDIKFTDEIEPVILPKLKPTNKETAIHVSNFAYPKGTVAAFSTLDIPIYTDELRYCAAMAIVDRKQNLQILAHIFPDYGDNNEKIIEYIFSHSNPKDLEISIIPGCYSDTGRTVAYMNDMVNKYAKDAQLNYYNFPADEITKSDYDVPFYARAVVLKNGSLTCCAANDITNKVINPEKQLLYFSEDVISK